MPLATDLMLLALLFLLIVTGSYIGTRAAIRDVEYEPTDPDEGVDPTDGNER